MPAVLPCLLWTSVAVKADGRGSIVGGGNSGGVSSGCCVAGGLGPGSVASDLGGAAAASAVSDFCCYSW